MSASLAQERRLEDGAVVAPPAVLISLATIALVSFDCALAGMVRAGQGIGALCCFFGLTSADLHDHLVRLGLPTPLDRLLRKPGPKGWSEADVRRLIVWRLAGVHPEVIGQLLDRRRSANAVRAKARRLGLPVPPRKQLHRPEPETLRDPAPGPLIHAQAPARAPTPSEVCGTAAGEVSVRGVSYDGAVSLHPAAGSLNETAGENDPDPRLGRKARSEGQRELPLFGVVGGTAAVPGAAEAVSPIVVDTPATELEPWIPTHESEVDLPGDLTWFGRIKRFRHANRAAVWVAFMLLAGGLSYKAAADRLGVTTGTFSTFRGRAGIPVDHDRDKAGEVFDATTAHITWKVSGFILQQETVSEDVPKARVPWFWVHKRDASRVKLRPAKRRRENIPGMGRSETFTIITRAMLEAEPWKFGVPFARERATVCA